MGEAVFARRASGLVREASLLDTIFFGMMNNAVAVCVWFALSAWYFYPGANPWIVSALTLPFSLIFATVWGILGGSMPRSGGSYVYNSRIIHPTRVGCELGQRWLRHAGVDMGVGALGRRGRASDMG